MILEIQFQELHHYRLLLRMAFVAAVSSSILVTPIDGMQLLYVPHVYLYI